MFKKVKIVFKRSVIIVIIKTRPEVSRVIVAEIEIGNSRKITLEECVVHGHRVVHVLHAVHVHHVVSIDVGRLGVTALIAVVQFGNDEEAHRGVV